MNRENNNEGFFYKVAAFAIFIVIAVLIVLISLSSITNVEENTDSHVSDIDKDAQSDAPDTSDFPDETDTPETTEAPDTTNTPDTTAPKETTAPPETSSAPTTPSTPSVEAPTANVTDELAAFLAKYPNTVLAQTEDAGQEYIDKIVFLGDSTTYGLRKYEMLKDGFNTTQVWTPKSGTLTLSNVSFATIVYPETNEEITIKEAVTRKKPDYLVITLGVNGVSFMGEDYFKSEYKKMLESVIEASPDTKIICQSIFPVARSYTVLNKINNDKIRAANKWIVEVADEVGVKFIDTYSVICDAEGWLPEAYQNGDGIHLNTQSFTLELNNIRTHAYID